MTTVFFGPRWDAPVLDDATEVPTPVGEPCYDCGEQIAAGDRGFLHPCYRELDVPARLEPVHAECHLATVMGHVVGVCPYTGHEPGRASARLVWQRAFRLRGE